MAHTLKTQTGITSAAGASPVETSQLEVFLKSNPASTGVLAGVVTMSGQIAAQLTLPALGCRLVALGFALLLAYYQVFVAQRRTRRESVFLVPIVAVILFTTGWGANGLIYEAYAREARAATEATASPAPQASLGDWIIDVIIPSAHAQSGDSRGDDSRRKRDGWKSW